MVAARHPAYQDPNCPYNLLLSDMTSEANRQPWSEAALCARVLYEVAAGRKQTPPPLRLALGAGAYSVIKSSIGNSERARKMEGCLGEYLARGERRGDRRHDGHAVRILEMILWRW